MADYDYEIESLSSGSSPIHVASSSRSKRADAFRNLDDEDDFDINEAQRILQGPNGNEASKDFDAMKIDEDLEDPLGREDDDDDDETVEEETKSPALLKLERMNEQLKIKQFEYHHIKQILLQLNEATKLKVGGSTLNGSSHKHCLLRLGKPEEAKDSEDSSPDAVVYAIEPRGLSNFLLTVRIGKSLQSKLSSEYWRLHIKISSTSSPSCVKLRTFDRWSNRSRIQLEIDGQQLTPDNALSLPLKLEIFLSLKKRFVELLTSKLNEFLLSHAAGQLPLHLEQCSFSDLRIPLHDDYLRPLDFASHIKKSSRDKNLSCTDFLTSRITKGNESCVNQKSTFIQYLLHCRTGNLTLPGHNFSEKTFSGLVASLSKSHALNVTPSLSSGADSSSSSTIRKCGFYFGNPFTLHVTIHYHSEASVEEPVSGPVAPKRTPYLISLAVESKSRATRAALRASIADILASRTWNEQLYWHSEAQVDSGALQDIQAIDDRLKSDDANKLSILSSIYDEMRCLITQNLCYV